MQEALDEKQYFRVKQFFGKFIERFTAQDRDVRNDDNITRLGRPFKSEPDFQVGKFNIDITTDSKYSEDLHLQRDYIDSKDNLLTYRKLDIPEMYELFGEGWMVVPITGVQLRDPPRLVALMARIIAAAEARPSLNVTP